MATVANPFLLVVGPSPGNSPHRGDKKFVTRENYEEPTLGQPHPEFYYRDARGYWEKIRELTVGMLRGFDPEFSEDDCYALSGQMNFGVGAFGKAERDAVETEYLRWVPQIIMTTLRPRIVVLAGLKGLLRRKLVQREIAASGAIQIDWSRADRELPFRAYQKNPMRFLAWSTPRPDGGTTTWIQWPNHPGRPPMSDRRWWRASIREAAIYFTDQRGALPPGLGDSRHSLRPFHPDDTDAVIVLWEKCGLTRSWNDPRRDIERKLSVQPELFLVAVEPVTSGKASGGGGAPKAGEKIIGTVMAGYEGHRGWINYLAVDPESRRHGIGRELMQRAEAGLLNLGCPKINLQIRNSNEAALGFYRSIGFLEDDVVSMGKRLIPDDLSGSRGV